MKKTLTLLFLCGITLMASAKYKKICSLVVGDSSTQVNFNRISFTIPEKAYSADTIFEHDYDNDNASMSIHFNSGVWLLVNYFRPLSPDWSLEYDVEGCKLRSSICSIIEYDSTLIKGFESRYVYTKTTNGYLRKTCSIWDPENHMMYNFRMESLMNYDLDPYKDFIKIITSIIFL